MIATTRSEAAALVATSSGDNIAPPPPPSSSHQPADEIMRSVAQVFYDIGVHSVNLDLAESSIIQALELYKTMYNNNDADRDDVLLMPDAYKVLIYAQLRLGQIAACQGRLSQAFVLLRALLLDESTFDKSNCILRMIAWYDLGMIWFRQDEPVQALGCFREALASASTDHIVSTIAAAAASTTVPAQDLETQERLLHFIPFLQDHIEYLKRCIENGASVYSLQQQRDHIASLSFSSPPSSSARSSSSNNRHHNNNTPPPPSSSSYVYTTTTNSATAPESMSFPWSLEILMPFWHSLPSVSSSNSTSTSAAAGAAAAVNTMNNGDGRMMSSSDDMMLDDDDHRHHPPAHSQSHHQQQQQDQQQATATTTTTTSPRNNNMKVLTVQDLLWRLSDRRYCAAAA